MKSEGKTEPGNVMEITQTKVLLCWYTSFIYQTFIIALLMYNVMVKKKLTYIDLRVLNINEGS